MRAIRAWHISMTYYGKLFREVASLSLREYTELIRGFADTNRNAFDCTNRLTTLRENLASAGYKHEVEQTDKQFLAEHRGYPSETAWEEFWTQYCRAHSVPPYPKDAL